MFEMLITAFFIGILLGIPPGPVLVAAGRRAITFGFRPAFAFNLGAMVGNMVYALAVYFGLAPLIAENDHLRLILWTIGGAWLCWLGWESMRSRLDIEAMQAGLLRESTWRGIAGGAALMLFNPVAVIAWIAIAGNFFANWNPNWPAQDVVGLFAIGAMLGGIMVWMSGILFALAWVRRFVSPRVVGILSTGAGLFLIGMGLNGWWSALKMMLLFD